MYDCRDGATFACATAQRAKEEMADSVWLRYDAHLESVSLAE